MQRLMPVVEQLCGSHFRVEHSTAVIKQGLSQRRLDHIVKVVQEGQTRRAPIERVADLLTGYFVPIVTLLAIITWVTWLSLGLSGVLPRDYLDISIGGWSK